MCVPSKDTNVTKESGLNVWDTKFQEMTENTSKGVFNIPGAKEHIDSIEIVINEVFDKTVSVGEEKHLKRDLVEKEKQGISDVNV